MANLDPAYGKGGAGGSGTPDNTTDGSIVLKDNGAFEDSAMSENPVSIVSLKPVLASNIPPEVVSTALTSIVVITENTPTTIDIPAGTGRIVTVSGDITLITWPEMLNVAITDILTTKSTRFVIDITESLVQLPFELTPETTRNYINLGFAVHSSGVIELISNDGLKAQNEYSQSVDLMEVLGVTRKEGLAITPYAGLSISKTAGILHSPGAGVGSGNAGQNIVEIMADPTGATFSRILQDGTIETASTQDLDPGFYDNAGVKTALPQPNDASIVYVYQGIDDVVGSLLVAYGQTVYSSVSDAEINADTDTRIIPAAIEQRTNLLARIILRSNATNVTLIDEAVFLPGAKFGVDITGGSAAAGAGGGDVSGGASSQLNEIPSYADLSGKLIKAESDVSILAGIIERLTVGEDLWLKVDSSNENVFIGRHIDTTGVPSLTNTTLLITSNATNAMVMTTLGNNSQSIDFIKSGVFRGKLSNNRDRNSIGLENANGKRLEILPNDTATFLVDKIGIGSAASGEDAVVSFANGMGAIRLPKATTAQRDAFSILTSGETLFNTDSQIEEMWDGFNWYQSGGKSEGCIVSTFQNTQPTLPIALDSYVRARLGGGQIISNTKNFTLGTDGAAYEGNLYRGVVTINFDYHIPPSLLDTKGYAFAIGRDGIPFTTSIHENNNVLNSGQYIQGTCSALMELANGAEVTLRVKQIIGTLEDDITFRNVSITFS